MRGNGYLGASKSKIWPCHSLRRPQFPIRRVSTTGWRLQHIWCFCASFSFDLVTLTVNQFLASYDYPFLSYGWLNLITYHHMERSMRMRRVKWPVH